MDMGFSRILRCTVPLLLTFLFLYLSYTKLPDVPLHECISDGKPCADTQHEVIEKEDVKRENIPRPLNALKEDSTYQQVVENSMRNCKGKNFKLGKMMTRFHDCITDDGEVLLEQYLQGWRELIKFMDSMGSVFTFISHETKTKIDILQGYLDGENGNSYRTVKSMIKYEVENKVVNFKYLPSDRVPSGCRTLLRIHRAFKWLGVYLYDTATSPKKDKTAEICADAYHKTLAHYHSWFIRQVAEVAFYAMPPLEEMYKVLCIRDSAEAKIVLLTTVDTITKVYNITQELYAANDMLDLP